MLERMRPIIAEQLDIDESQITEDSSFKDDLGADSLAVVELIMALEDEFSIEIPTENLEAMSTVKDVMDYLKEHDLMDNTVIVYTSDQGFYMGEHGWFDKRFMYEESFRTPLIIRYPGKKQGLENYDLVQNIDYAPTYLDIAGIEKPGYMSGTSLVPLLDGETPEDWRQYLYYHYYDYPAIHMVRRHDGVRDSRYKLIHFYGGKDGQRDAVNCNELYDLESDPNELHNLYGDPAYKETQDRLQQQLDRFRTDLKVDEF